MKEEATTGKGKHSQKHKSLALEVDTLEPRELVAEMI